MRFVFSPPTEDAAGLLTLPWEMPLADWTDDRLVEIRMRGISRHVVRFVEDGGELYALKALDERLARREYRMLRDLADAGVPAVKATGIVADRGKDADAILVTRFLDYSTTYRALFSSPRGGLPTDRLLDALVELLARLHLSGFFWGDCSLSNTLFRYDAGALEAYLVDAETSERHPTLTAGQRHYDVELAEERIGGELFDLQSGELLPEEVDPIAVADELPRRYGLLWDELTREELLRPQEQRYRIAQRLRRLNELGFDADEVEMVSTARGNRLRLRTKVSESGHHARKLFLRTGLVVEENQARRLLNDIASFRAYLEQKRSRPVPEMVAASQWLNEVYDPVVAAIPEDLRGRLRTRRDLPRDPRAPLVHVGGSGLRRRDGRRRAVLLPDGAAGSTRAAQRGWNPARRGWRVILTAAGCDHGQPDQERQHRDDGGLDQLAVRLVQAELLELPLLRRGPRLPGAAARVDDARVEPDLDRAIRGAAGTAVPHSHAAGGPRQAERDEQQGERRRQPAHDERHTAQAQQVPATGSHRFLLTARHPARRPDLRLLSGLPARLIPKLGTAASGSGTYGPGPGTCRRIPGHDGRRSAAPRSRPAPRCR